MLRMLGLFIHQSWLIVSFAIGIVAGVILGVTLRINYFATWWWCVAAIILLVFTLLKPRLLYVVLALIAGMVVAFVRVTDELGKQQRLGVDYSVTAGIETEPWVISIRDWYAEQIRDVVPEPEVNLGLSYLMGMKSGLPGEIAENLKVVGLTHIVVASGTHLSILVEIARKMFGRLSRFAGLLFSIIFIGFFMSMVGWTPSILRAGIMSILTLLAWYVGREFAAWRIILLVAAGTLMINPNYLTSLGWLLSFASYFGIMILGPEIKQFFYGKKKPGKIAEVMIATVAATVMTLPITLYFFGQLSLISILANLLILPTLPLAMGLVFMTGMMAKLPGVGVICGFLSTKILDYHIAVVELFGGWKEFLVKIPMHEWWVFLFYLMIFVLIALLHYYKSHE